MPEEKLNQHRTACQTPKISKTKCLGKNPRFKPVRSHLLNITPFSLHPVLTLQVCIALTGHTAPLSPAATLVVPGLGLWDKCEPGLWQRSPSAQNKLKCKLVGTGDPGGHTLCSHSFSLSWHVILWPHQHVWWSQRYQNFSILEWSSSNNHTIETSTLIQNNPPIPWKHILKTILFSISTITFA